MSQIDKVKAMKRKKAKSMKGLELPINMIVVIAIAVLVLVAVAAFFSGALTGGTQGVSLEAAFQDACTALKTNFNCVPSQTGITTKYTLPGSSSPASLLELCQKRNEVLMDSATDKPKACANLCGCNLR